MFETLAINFRKQGQGGPPWDEGDDDPNEFVIGGGSRGPDPSDFEDGEPIEGTDEEHPEIDPPAGPVENLPPTAEGRPAEDDAEPFQEIFNGVEDVPEEEQPIEVRASEAELLYAHLQIKTDFENEFIEEMLEFEPDEEERMRIDELRHKRRELRQMEQQMPPMSGGMGGMPPQGMPPDGGMTTIVI